MMRLAVVVLTAAALLPATASAKAPERYDIDFVVSDTIDCSQFNPDWTFNDDFTDFFTGRGHVWLDSAGNPVRAIGARVPPLKRRQQRHRLHVA